MMPALGFMKSFSLVSPMVSPIANKDQRSLGALIMRKVCNFSYSRHTACEVVFVKVCIKHCVIVLNIKMLPISRVPAMPVKVPKHVVVHPIVLLSVVDHFNRLSRIGNQRRVVGVLLGAWRGGVVDVATSFAGRFFMIHTLCVCVYVYL